MESGLTAVWLKYIQLVRNSEVAISMIVRVICSIYFLANVSNLFFTTVLKQVDRIVIDIF